MSRVYDALQRSQGENPSASPLVSTPQEPTAPIEASAAEIAAGVPVGAAPETGVLAISAERVLRPEPKPEQRLVSLSAPESPGAEMFRVFSTRLAHMQAKRRLQKILITSAEGDEGKSVVSVNLAFALAQRANSRTLLIEADLRRPTASSLLTSSALSGITEWSEGKLPLEHSLYRLFDMPLWFLSAGRGIDEPMPLLESERFAKMLTTVSANFDWVVLDGTPMLPMADSTSLSRLCDGVLVVVREGRTRRKVLNKALGSIEESKLLGTVFNEASMMKVGYDRYYGSKYGKSKKGSNKEEAEKVHAASA